MNIVIGSPKYSQTIQDLLNVEESVIAEVAFALSHVILHQTVIMEHLLCLF